MKLSTKGRYAMVALVDLALARPDALLSLAEISKRLVAKDVAREKARFPENF